MTKNLAVKTDYSHSHYRREVVNRVKKIFENQHNPNVSIWLPNATVGDLDYWRKSFSIVEWGFLGYVYFESYSK